MVSFNPFKKKEDEGFSLDESSLPSLSDMNGNQESHQEPQNNEQDTMSSSNPFSQTPSNMQPQDLSQSTTQDSLPQDSNISQGNSLSGQNSSQGASDAVHRDYTKAKLDAIDSKISLLEARYSSMEQKIDAILSLISAEVSDETKAKLKLNSMLEQIKNGNK